MSPSAHLSPTPAHASLKAQERQDHRGLWVPQEAKVQGVREESLAHRVHWVHLEKWDHLAPWVFPVHKGLVDCLFLVKLAALDQKEILVMLDYLGRKANLGQLVVLGLLDQLDQEDPLAKRDQLGLEVHQDQWDLLGLPELQAPWGILESLVKMVLLEPQGLKETKATGVILPPKA